MRKSSIRLRATAPKAPRNRSDDATPMLPIRWVPSRIEEAACPARWRDLDFDADRAEHADKCQPSARPSRSLRLVRPNPNLVHLVVHGSPLVWKSSACEVSQSTVLRGSGVKAASTSSRASCLA